MTWSTTHLGIATLLFLLIFPKSYKEWARKNPKYMLLCTLLSILPDVDFLLSIPHRSWTHSIFVLLVVSLISYVTLLAVGKLTIMTRRFIVVSTFFWFSHILFDLTLDPSAPIGLFYPLDLRYYELLLGVVLILSPLVFPTQIFYQLNTITPNKGINLFFTQWTNEQRLTYFGTDTINYPIADIFIHLTLFLFYINQVALPGISGYLKNRTFPKMKNINLSFTKRVCKIVKKYLFINILLLSLIFALFFSSFGQGETYTDNDSSNITFQVLSNQLTLYNSITYSIPENSEAKVDVFLFPLSLNVTISFGQFNAKFYEHFTEVIDNSTEQFELQNLTYEKSLRGIKNGFRGIMPNDWVSGTPQKNVTLAYNFSNEFAKDSRDVSLAFLLNNWANDTYFHYSVFVNITYTISRASVLQVGFIFIIFVCFAEIAVLAYSFIKTK